MAIDPSTTYTGQVAAPDADYPYGSARNVAFQDDPDATPFEQAWLNDLWGFLQALLDAEGVTPSGNPDTVQASQYLNVLDTRFPQRVVAESVSGIWDFTNGVQSAGSNVLVDSDLQENGGTIPEINRINAFSAEQRIERTGGKTWVSQSENDAAQFILSSEDSNGNEVWNVLSRGMNGAGDGYASFEDADLYSFDNDVYINTAGNNNVTATTLTDLVIGDGTQNKGIVMRASDTGFSRFAVVSSDGSNLVSYLEWDGSANEWQLEGSIDIRDGLKIGGGATIDKTLRATGTLPSGSYSENENITTITVTGAEVGDMCVVNARDPDNSTYPSNIVGSVGSSNTVGIRAGGSFNNSASVTIHVTVLKF